VRPAQPVAKVGAAAHRRRRARNVRLEVNRADPARVQAREQADEAREVVLLLFRGRLGIRRRDRVQERPRAAA